MDGTERIILRDGSLFLIPAAGPNHKEVLKNTIGCIDESDKGIRSWYETLVRHCSTHGFYAHPLYCLRKDHGGPWGFTCGDESKDDLPSRMLTLTQHSSDTLFKLLQVKGMFLPSSDLPNQIKHCNGDGYKALKRILFQSHPVFNEQPATLIASYPSQEKDTSMAQYYDSFTDFLQMRAFISDIDSCIDNPPEMDLFITRAQHGVWLNGVTREERNKESKKYKYTSTQIVETLETFLMLPDSPDRRASSHTRNRSAASTTSIARPLQNPPPRTSRPSPPNLVTPSRPSLLQPPRPRRVHLVQTYEHTSSDIIDTEDPYEDLSREIDAIVIPADDPSARTIHSLYKASIMALHTDSPPMQCIVCGGTHTFDACQILMDTKFLKSHYICFCQQLRHEASARATAHPNAANVPGARVHHVNTDDVSDYGNNDTATDESDFCNGHC